MCFPLKDFPAKLNWMKTFQLPFIVASFLSGIYFIYVGNFARYFLLWWHLVFITNLSGIESAVYEIGERLHNNTAAVIT